MIKTTVEEIIRGIMDNFPEASESLRCCGWKYKSCKFLFQDYEDEKYYKIGLPELTKAFELMTQSGKWPKGLTQPPCGMDSESWEDWLCQADALDFDAFVQLACFGEVIYG